MIFLTFVLILLLKLHNFENTGNQKYFIQEVSKAKNEYAHEISGLFLSSIRVFWILLDQYLPQNLKESSKKNTKIPLHNSERVEESHENIIFLLQKLFVSNFLGFRYFRNSAMQNRKKNHQKLQ